MPMTHEERSNDQNTSNLEKSDFFIGVLNYAYSMKKHGSNIFVEKHFSGVGMSLKSWPKNFAKM